MSREYFDATTELGHWPEPGVEKRIGFFGASVVAAATFSVLMVMSFDAIPEVRDRLRALSYPQSRVRWLDHTE